MEVPSGIAEFWSWFSSQEAQLRQRLEQAIANEEFDKGQQVINEIQARLGDVSPALDLNVNVGNGNCLLTLRATTGETHDIANDILRQAPTLPHWRFSPSTASSPPKNIIIREESGGELIIPYGEIRFTILPPRSDGKWTIAFLLPREFDPQGPQHDLYASAAEFIFQFVFGHIPEKVGNYAMLPANNHPTLRSQPLSELKETWDKLDK